MTPIRVSPNISSVAIVKIIPKKLLQSAHVHPTVKQVTRSQTGLSLTFLALLAIVAAGVLYTQSDFNPAVVQWQQLAAGGSQEPVSKQTAPERTLVPLPDQLVGLTPVESFDAQNLSDKINGKAELYLSSGFKRLESQRFSRRGQSQPWLEMFAYDMDKFENAYSVFSVQRRENAASADLVEYAYQTENALFLVHGPYYLEIIASEPTAEMRQAGELLARSFISQTRVARETISENRLFPEENLVADSVARIPANAFGLERLDKVFTAVYLIEGREMTAFLSRRESAAEASELAEAYRQFLIQFGGEARKAELSIENAALINILDSYEIVFAVGPYLAGVREAAQPQQAETLALKLYQRLKTVSDESGS